MIWWLIQEGRWSCLSLFQERGAIKDFCLFLKNVIISGWKSCEV